MSVSFWNPDGSEDSDDFNVSQGNAKEILAVLGVEVGEDGEGWCGEMPAPMVVEACERALALLRAEPTLDAGRPWQKVRGNEARELLGSLAGLVGDGRRGPTIIDCGRREGYMLEKLSRLREMARRAGFGLIVWS
jgi:hypothetical protein